MHFLKLRAALVFACTACCTSSAARESRASAAVLAQAPRAPVTSGAQPSGAQSPHSPAPELPPGVLATIDGQALTLLEYKDYLYALNGNNQLQELIYQRLLEREAARLGLSVAPEEVEAEFQAYWATLLARQGGDAQAVEQQLEEQGQDRAALHQRFLPYKRVELLQTKICQKTRVVDPAALHARFEREHGQGGVKVELSHIFLNRAMLKAELVKAGTSQTDVTLEKLDIKLHERAQELMARLAAGADFAQLARDYSHDAGSKQAGGKIEGYNYDRYGPELADAVRRAEVGKPVGPVQGQAGIHLMLVTSRVATKFEDARDKLKELVARDPASPKEQMDLRKRLLDAAQIVVR